MTNDLQPYLTVRVEPDDMVRYVHDLMSAPARVKRQWDEDSPQSRAAHLRWSALNRAFGDARVSPWMTPRKPDQIQVPVALIGAAGVARLTVAEDQVVFDIPTLLDATLRLCEPAGNA